MLELHGKGAHAFVVTAANVQIFWREVEFVLGHGFCDVQNLLFDGTDLAVHHGSHRLRSLLGGRGGGEQDDP
jgi:hypothetical protein